MKGAIDWEIWGQAPARPTLGPAEVHVWIADLRIGGERASELERILSAEERERAGRFKFEKDHVQYVAARGFLRQILGRYMRIDPASLLFRYNGYGKPYLADEFGSDLRFNVAHSHGLALFGITSRLEIGVDIERFRENFATQEIAERFFAPEEVKTLLTIEPAKRTEAFFDCWTRKEAFIKARGMGLSLSLRDFVVAFGAGATPALLNSKEDPDAPRRWQLRNLEPAPGYAGAVAVESREIALKLWKFGG